MLTYNPLLASIQCRKNGSGTNDNSQYYLSLCNAVVKFGELNFVNFWLLCWVAQYLVHTRTNG